MLLKLLHTNDQGFTFIELLIALISISLIAMALSSFVTTSFRTNELIISETETLVTANIVFDGISEEAKYGFGFNVSDDKKKLSFLTPHYTDTEQQINSTISLIGNKVCLNRDDGTSKILNDNHNNIEALEFTKLNDFNVNVTLTVAGNEYQTTIRSLNFVPSSSN